MPDVTHWDRITCRRKKRYRDPLAALSRLIEIGTDGSAHQNLGVYECDVCGGLHIGHRRMRRFKSFASLADRNVISRLLNRKLEAKPCPT